MSTIEIEVDDLQARSVEFAATELIVTLHDGRRIATPLMVSAVAKCIGERARAF